jgi:hypothetical protein
MVQFHNLNTTKYRLTLLCLSTGNSDVLLQLCLYATELPSAVLPQPTTVNYKVDVNKHQSRHPQSAMLR